ncbi:hypothetical protein [Methanosarcina mazei]|jgi:hypothetical protein|uniref:Uncharacterized protein n=1 Tax=Methanosarcina mazei LYC TaxID=1434114 RepID=A0A0E3RRG7_METMZ|nr:hypothetical protein [Methanosarcina mazei]AKB68193.1 hypothetical protein MSMAL_1650 [Methanosarcina mazei LYC]
MDNDRLKPLSSVNKTEGGSGCGPGCNCDRNKIGKKGKAIICLVVVLAAVIVLAQATTDNRSVNAQTDLSLGGNPLASLASLNDVATQKDAFFIYLPANGQEPNEDVKKEIEAAAEKAQSQGTEMGLFILDEDSEDYAQVTSQVSAPCVLAIVKGSGNSVIVTNISEVNLLKSLVTASRPSSCSPGGCGQSC